MIIKKFKGKTEAEARKNAVNELGEAAVIMNVKTVKPTGFFKWFKSSTYEVTAAIEDAKEEPIKPFFQNAMNRELSGGTKVPQADNRENMSQMENKPINPGIIPDSRSSYYRKDSESDLGERIDNLQHFLEKQFKAEEEKKETTKIPQPEVKNDKEDEKNPIVTMIREKLLDNEVDEKYVNLIIDEVMKSVPNNAGLDTILSSVYQRVILKFGEPSGISLSGRKPKVVFFVGPTGVGKTTTIAKIASHYKVEQGKNISLLTADTYRIAAADQLRIYADILNVPLTIIYSAEELNNAVNSMRDFEIILVDTAGFSHRNLPQKKEMQELLEALDDSFEKEVYLVVSATTKYKDLIDIVDTYSELCDYKLIFTKLDETMAYGNLLNIKLHTNASMSYSTNGQNVPDDIEVFNAQRLVKQLLGGK